jgi:hypothetical protein
MEKTIISADLKITGNLSGKAEIDVAGSIDGDVEVTSMDILDERFCIRSRKSDDSTYPRTLSWVLGGRDRSFAFGGGCKSRHHHERFGSANGGKS